jgi:hypothetical protein
MDINEFKTRLGAGGARPNQFQVILAFPSYVASPPLSDSILVTGAALPASTVNPAIIQYRGREVKLAGERIFDPYTITIVNDTEQKIRRAMEQWMEGMNNKESNEGRLTPADYQADLRIKHLDRNDNTLPGGDYILRDSFPIQLSEIALQYGQNDILEEYTVTFQYRHYEIQGENLVAPG